MQCFFVIRTGPNGVTMCKLNKEILEKRLAESYWGDIQPERVKAGTIDLTGSEGFYIIKGEDIIPRAKEVVTAWEV